LPHKEFPPDRHHRHDLQFRPKSQVNGGLKYRRQRRYRAQVTRKDSWRLTPSAEVYRVVEPGHTRGTVLHQVRVNSVSRGCGCLASDGRMAELVTLDQ
jgi:hypothetical protein